MYHSLGRFACLVLLLAAAPLAHAQQQADLSLSKAVDNPTPVAGTQVTFTVTVSNAGPRAANTVVVRDRLPAGYTYVSHQATRGSYNASNGNWNLALPVSTSGTLTLVATVKAQGNHVNVSEVKSSSLPDPDSTPGNGNTAEDDYASRSTTPVPPNVAPVITGQVPLSTPEETPLTITLADLTAIDPDNVYPDDFTLSMLAGAGYALTGPNEITPDTGFVGDLTVPVVVNDGAADSAPFDLLVTVTPVNDVPVITAQVPLSTPEETPLTLSLADLTVIDPDDVYPTDFTLQVQSGTNYTLTGANEITPNLDFAGALTVPVTVNDGAADSAPFDLLVTVTPVNDVPVITAQVPLSTPEETPLTIALADLTAIDPDNVYPDDFTLSMLAGAGYALTGPNEITPDTGFVGDLTVPVVVNDGAADSAPFDLLVTVTPVNDVPVITAQVPLSTPEETPLTLSLADLTVIDPDDVYPTDFTLQVQLGTNYTLTGANEITPNPNFAGALTVPVTVNDGAADSAPFDLLVTVTPVNDVPVITAQVPLSTPEETPLTLSLADLTVIDPDDVYPTDFTLQVQSGTNYTLTGANEITPNLDFAGALTVPVTVNDGAANSAPFDLLVTVTPVNDVPVITAQAPLSTPVDTPLTITLADLTVIDPDDVYPDEFTLSMLAGAGYALTGPNEITPDTGFVGDLTVPALVNDGSDDSAPFALLVSVTETANARPVITGASALGTPEETPLTITLSDVTVSDPDNAYPDDFTLAVQPGAGYALTGAHEITPPVDFNGLLDFAVIVNDGADDSEPFVLQVDVAPVNDPPAITGQIVLRTPGHTALTITLADLTVIDPDDAYPNDFTLSVLPGTSYDITNANEITPVSGFAGELSVPVTVDDGTEASAPFALDVTVKRPPNIIVVMLDDLDTRSLDDLLGAGLMPTLQSYVVDRAVEFSESYVTTPLCCPSRATFLSGQYPHNTQVVNNNLQYQDMALHKAVGLFDDSVTLATRLQALGYTTLHVGKYLNGYGMDASLTNLSPAFAPTYVPPGWTSWNGLVDLSTYCVYNYSMNRTGTVTQYPRPAGQSEDTATYQTNVLADVAESLVLEHRDDEAPFFLWVAPLTPHAEGCADAYGGSPPADGDFAQRIRPAPEFKTAPVPAFVASPSYDEDMSDKPAWAQVAPLTAANNADVVEAYQFRLRAMLSIDVLLSRVIAALGNELADTVLIFTSDNGWFYGEHRLTGKILAYHEAAQVPLYVVVPDLTGPSTRTQVVLNNDLAPTILNLASPGYGDASFDGRSMMPLLGPGAPQGWTDRAQFLIEYSRALASQGENIHPIYLALRSTTSLYVESFGGLYYQSGTPPLIGLERYDLLADPNEMSSQLHYPQNAPDPLLSPWLTLLKSCVTQTCKQYEDGIPGP